MSIIKTPSPLKLKNKEKLPAPVATPSRPAPAPSYLPPVLEKPDNSELSGVLSSLKDTLEHIQSTPPDMTKDRLAELLPSLIATLEQMSSFLNVLPEQITRIEGLSFGRTVTVDNLKDITIPPAPPVELPEPEEEPVKITVERDSADMVQYITEEYPNGSKVVHHFVRTGNTTEIVREEA